MMEDVSLSLIVAALSALVGLLCLGLAVTALLRIRKAKHRRAQGFVPVDSAPVETPAELQSFAAKQMSSAAVMLVLALIIYIYS